MRWRWLSSPRFARPKVVPQMTATGACSSRPAAAASRNGPTNPWSQIVAPGRTDMAVSAGEKALMLRPGITRRPPVVVIWLRVKPTVRIATRCRVRSVEFCGEVLDLPIGKRVEDGEMQDALAHVNRLLRRHIADIHLTMRCQMDVMLRWPRH